MIRFARTRHLIGLQTINEMGGYDLFFCLVI